MVYGSTGAAKTEICLKCCSCLRNSDVKPWFRCCICRQRWKRVSGSLFVIVVMVTTGFGLAFIAYPEVVTYLEPPQFWASFFFFLLILLAVDSQVGLFK